MFRLIGIAISVVTTALALYAVTVVVPGITIHSPEQDKGMGFIIVALVFVAVNTVVGPILRLAGRPLKFFSYALSSLAVNAALLWITHRISTEFGLGFYISDWFSLIAGAAMMAIAMWIITTVRAFAKVR